MLRERIRGKKYLPHNVGWGFVKFPWVTVVVWGKGEVNTLLSNMILQLHFSLWLQSFGHLTISDCCPNTDESENQLCVKFIAQMMIIVITRRLLKTLESLKSRIETTITSSFCLWLTFAPTYDVDLQKWFVNYVLSLRNDSVTSSYSWRLWVVWQGLLKQE